MLTLTAQEQQLREQILKEQKRVFAVVAIAFAVVCVLIVTLAPKHQTFQSASAARLSSAARHASVPSAPDNASTGVQVVREGAVSHP
jgi:hypothetical protein